MNTKIKVLCTATAMLLPASAFAQDAIAVALGAAFMPVEVTTTSNWIADDVDVVIPAVGTTGSGSVTLPWPISATIPITNVTGTTTEQTVTITGPTGSSTTTTQNMELVSISVAAASGQHAAASVTANAKGATAANSGASVRDIAVLRAETSPAGGGQAFTSQVLVNY